jgi:hypothetical protein
MAETGEGADLQAHQRTFNGFTQVMTWGTVAVALVVAFVIFLIAS